MLNIALISLFIACGDSEKQTIPAPPPPAPKAAPAKPEANKAAEGTAPVAAAAGDANAEAGDANAEAGDAVDGTQPEVQVSEKLITTGEVKAAQSKMIKGKVEKQLKAKAMKAGFDSIKNVKLVKNECKAGGTCVGIGQATAFKSSVTYSVGNAVAVSQEDGSTKNGVISSINGDDYAVRYADDSEATVALKDLGLQK